MKVYCFDLDGTILIKNDNKYIIYDETIRLIEYLFTKGNILVLSTGRMKIDSEDYRGIKKYFSYFSYLNGSLIYDGKNIVKQVFFTRKQLTKIVNYCRKKKIYAIFQGITKTYSIYDKNIDLQYYPNYNKFIVDYSSVINKRIASISILSNDSFLDIVDGVIQYPWRLGGSHLTPNTNKVDILSLFSDKTIISLGDGINDLEVLKASNISICFSDSEDRLKKATNYVCDDKKSLFEFYKKRDLL